MPRRVGARNWRAAAPRQRRAVQAHGLRIIPCTGGSSASGLRSGKVNHPCVWPGTDSARRVPVQKGLAEMRVAPRPVDDGVIR